MLAIGFYWAGLSSKNRARGKAENESDQQFAETGNEI